MGLSEQNRQSRISPFVVIRSGIVDAVGLITYQRPTFFAGHNEFRQGYSGRKKGRTPCIYWVYGLLWTTLNVFLVPMTGIELVTFALRMLKSTGLLVLIAV
jgi:hypothetical protein